MKKSFILFLLAGLLSASFAACTGNAGDDGRSSMEGSADPANDGGKLGGSDAPDNTRTTHSSDTTHVK